MKTIRILTLLVSALVATGVCAQSTKSVTVNASNAGLRYPLNFFSANSNLMNQSVSALTDPQLMALRDMVPSVDKLQYWTSSSTVGLTTLTPYMRILLAATDAASAKIVLGVVDDAQVAAIAALTPATNQMIYWQSDTTAAMTSITPYMRTLLAASDASAAQTILEVTGGDGGSGITGYEVDGEGYLTGKGFRSTNLTPMELSWQDTNPSITTTGIVAVYSKSDGNIYTKQQAGSERRLARADELSGSGGTGGWDYSGTLQTSGNTPTAAWTYSVATNKSVRVHAAVTAAGSVGGAYDLYGLFKRGTGGASTVATTNLLGAAFDESSSIDAALGLSGNTIQLNVTGITAESFNWAYDVDVQDSDGAGGGTTSTLTDGLVYFVRFEETSGSAVPTTGSGTLADSGSVGTAAGITGNARGPFSAGNYLSTADGASISLPASDWTIGCGFYYTSGSWPYIFSKSAGQAAASYEYQVVLDTALMQLSAYASFGTNDETVRSLDTVLTAAWNYMLLWYTRSDYTLHLRVNGGTEYTTVMADHPIDGTNPLYMGIGYGTMNPLNGRVDNFGIWNRVLTPTEQTAAATWNP